MKLVYLTHSLRSCWNHGNAHFLRGLVRALHGLGHEVDVFEPRHGWSLTNLYEDQGCDGLSSFHRVYPDLQSSFYEASDLERITDGADVVIAHEWTPADVVEQLAVLRREGGRFLLLFHDTHHRAISDPDSVNRHALEDFDAVLAFGESLSAVYRQWGFRVFNWHEAADTSHFYPRKYDEPYGVVWIGNWGDNERTAELDSFLFAPVSAEGLPLTVRGVRYPAEAKERLAQINARYDGWIGNADVPDLFARYRVTVHVPRRYYVDALPGIPTIRMFEALACGIPLVSAWWPDSETLFRPGKDYLVARNGSQMRTHLRDVHNDAALRDALAASGLETIRTKHSCRHRAGELQEIINALRGATTHRATA